MSDAPTPPPSATPPPDPAPPAPRPRRGRTILARLAQAVREQNWTAVALELGIVVLGVVIGFQVTAWGAERADRANEQTYLRQLARDLAETERLADDLARTMVPFERAPRRLAQAHYLPEPPPRDSVLAWASVAPVYFDASPVLGTVEALVATGDIGLVRDDSLRVAITAYLDKSRENVRGWEAWKEGLVGHTHDYGRTAPIATIFAESLGPAALDSLDRADHWMALAPPGVPLPAFDTDAFVRDERMHRLMVLMAIAKENMATHRRDMAAHAAALREQVEAHLQP